MSKTRWANLITATAGMVFLGTSSSAQVCTTTTPPADAIVLFDGKDLSGWKSKDGQPCQWALEDGAMVSAYGDAVSEFTYGDCQLHVEFNVPLMPGVSGQMRGNSGVYVQGVYEVQVLDSYGISPITAGDCGGVYGQAPPMVNACLPPGSWQSYDIFFRAARFDDQGKVTEPARISVMHNSLWIHHNVQANPTPAGVTGEPVEKGPLMLQFHGCPIKYRNIWVRPLNP